MAKKGKVEIVVSAVTDAAEKSINKLKSGIDSVGGVASKVGTVAAAGFAALTATVGAVGKAALDAYADYEQLVGGMDKLFGDASSKVQEYAANAYKTAGVSANQYMTQVTGFSASLISSLGGDTNAAADLANTAMVSMADNVNTFGTNMEDVQNTFRGFAKSNYTMLDNLSLGYGGTQSEMQRLIKDSAALTAEQEELGLTVDASSMSFDNIVKAIAVMQKHMGIAGTTSKEAANTISGSMAMAQAAWENLLTGIADSDADLTGLTNQFLEALGLVAKNVAPRVAQIGQGIINALPAALAGIGDVLAPILSEALATAWNIAVNALAGLGISLPSIDSSQILGAFSSMIEWGSKAFEKLKEVASFLAGEFMSAWDTLGAAVGNAVTAAVEAISPFSEYFTLNMLPVIVSFAAEFVSVFTGILNSIQPVGDLVSNLANTISSILYNAFALLMPIVSQVGSLLAQLNSVLAPIATQIISFLAPAVNSIITAFGNLANAVLPVVSSALQIVISVIQVAIPVISTIANVVTSVIGVVVTLIAQVITTVVNAVALITSAIGVAMSVVSGIIATVSGVLTIIFTAVGGFVSSIVATITGLINTIITTFSSMVNSVIGFVTGLFSTIASIFSMIVSTVSGAAMQVYSSVTSAFSSLVSSVAGAVGSVLSTVSGIPGQIMGVFAGAGSWLVSAGAQIINGLTKGIQSAIGGVISAVTGAVGSVISRAKNALGIHSPSRVFDREIGRMIPAGAAQGVRKAAGEYYSAVDDVFAYSPTLESDMSIGANQVAAAQSQTSVSQTLNFYQEVQTPAQLARVARMQSMYGLAGA